MPAPTISYIVRTNDLPVAAASTNPTQPVYGDQTTSLSIIGTNLTGIVSVTVGGMLAAFNSSFFPTRLDFSVPQGPWTTGQLLDVVVTTSGGSTTAANSVANWIWYWVDPLGGSPAGVLLPGVVGSFSSSYDLISGVEGTDWSFASYFFGSAAMEILTTTGINWQDRTGNLVPTGANTLEGVFETGVRCWDVFLTPDFRGSWSTLNASVGFMDSGQTNGVLASIDSSGNLTLVAQDSTTPSFNQSATTSFSYATLLADVSTDFPPGDQMAGFRLALEYDPGSHLLTATIYICQITNAIPVAPFQQWGYGEGGTRTDGIDAFARNVGWNLGSEVYGTPWTQASLTLDSVNVLPALQARSLYPSNSMSLASSSDSVYATEWGYENQAPPYGASNVLSGTPASFIDTSLPGTETAITASGFPSSGLSLSDAHMVVIYDPLSFTNYYPAWSVVSNQILVTIPNTWPDLSSAELFVYLPGLTNVDIPIVIHPPVTDPAFSLWTYGPQGAPVNPVFRFDGTPSTDPFPGRIVAWDWFFDDGTTQTGPIVQKGYLFGSGDHSVALMVTDSQGRKASTEQSVTA